MTSLYTRSWGDVVVLFTAVLAAPGVTLLRTIVNRSR